MVPMNIMHSLHVSLFNIICMLLDHLWRELFICCLFDIFVVVLYNRYAGSVVALGGDTQRAALYATQASGALGCFAFTECGAGVMSGLGIVVDDPFIHPSIQMDETKAFVPLISS
jgi:hypothetical protein